jgi:hypothetical protein
MNTKFNLFIIIICTSYFANYSCSFSPVERKKKIEYGTIKYCNSKAVLTLQDSVVDFLADQAFFIGNSTIATHHFTDCLNLFKLPSTKTLSDYLVEYRIDLSTANCNKIQLAFSKGKQQKQSDEQLQRIFLQQRSFLQPREPSIGIQAVVALPFIQDQPVRAVPVASNSLFLRHGQPIIQFEVEKNRRALADEERLGHDLEQFRKSYNKEQ